VTQLRRLDRSAETDGRARGLPLNAAQRDLLDR